METIGEQKVWSFIRNANKAVPMTCTAVRKNGAHPLRSFMDLATKVAELQFMNRDYVLLFRGQGSPLLSTRHGSSHRRGKS
jgi:hypothetical protein